MKPQLFYHFTGDTLRNGDPLPKVGKWLEFKGKLKPCHSGLHASEHPFDALAYAPGNKLHLVWLGKNRIPHGDPVDKWVSNQRKIIASIDAEKLLRVFARRVALDVIHLWNAPEVVKRFLETGDESIRSAAWSAGRSAAQAAAWDKHREALKQIVEEAFSKQ